MGYDAMVAVDNGGANSQHPMVFEGFHDNLNTYSVNVSNGNSYSYLPFIVVLSCHGFYKLKIINKKLPESSKLFKRFNVIE